MSTSAATDAALPRDLQPQPEPAAEGRRAIAAAHADPIHGEDGALVHAVSLLTDVADRDRREQSTGDFLVALGHELRNPLGPMTNAVHILRSKPAPDSQAQWALDLIERQVEDLVCLIELVSEVSRLPRDSASIEHEPFDVATLVAAAEERARPVVSRKGQTCALTLPPPGATAFGDVARLQRAVESLIHTTSRLRRSEDAIEVCVAVGTNGWSTSVGLPEHGDGAVASATGDRSGVDDVRAPARWAGLIFAGRVAELHGGVLAARVRRDRRLGYDLSLPLRPPSPQ